MKLEKKKFPMLSDHRTYIIDGKQIWLFIYIYYSTAVHTEQFDNLKIFLKLPKSQVGPVNPGGHIHRQEPSLLTQVPPCLQGKYMHSSLSVKHNNTNQQHLTHSHLSGKVFSTKKVLFVANLPTSIKLLVHVPILTHFIKSLQFW